MTLPDFLRFDPVPVRARHNGWSPGVQRRFVLALARGAGPAEAARGVGRSRQTAYALRDKPGAEGFVAAWGAALDFAADARRAGSAPALMHSGIDTILTPRFYRGRLVGFVQREDTGHALRTLKQLDTIADRLARSDLDPAVYYDAADAFARLQNCRN